MSDSQSDSDLNVSHYDLEDDLNCYGSPVYVSPSTVVRVDDERVAPSRQNVLVDERTQVSAFQLSNISVYNC